MYTTGLARRPVAVLKDAQMSDSPVKMAIMIPVVMIVVISIFVAGRLDRWSAGLPPATKSASDTRGRSAFDEASMHNLGSATGWGEVRIFADESGHYRVSAEINGSRIGSVLVDTGASTVVLTYDDAMSAGVFPRAEEFTVPADTANGVGHVARVRLNRIQVGSVAVEDVEAMVAEPGALSVSLLGMSFLSRLRGFRVSQGVLALDR